MVNIIFLNTQDKQEMIIFKYTRQIGNDNDNKCMKSHLFSNYVISLISFIINYVLLYKIFFFLTNRISLQQNILYKKIKPVITKNSKYLMIS